MRLGYSRPLEATDLYKLQDDRASGVIAERITRSFEERQRKAAEYNFRLANGEISPGLRGVWWSIRGRRREREKEWREKMGRKKASLTLAVNDSVFWFFWSGGILRLISDVILITSPLLVKVTPILSPRPTHPHLSIRPSFGSLNTHISPIVLDRSHPRLGVVSVSRSVCSSFRFLPLSLRTTLSTAPRVLVSCYARD